MSAVGVSAHMIFLPAEWCKNRVSLSVLLRLHLELTTDPACAERVDRSSSAISAVSGHPRYSISLCPIVRIIVSEAKCAFQWRFRGYGGCCGWVTNDFGSKGTVCRAGSEILSLGKAVGIEARFGAEMSL